MTLIYRLLIAIVLVFTLWNLFEEDSIKDQATAALSSYTFSTKIIND